MKYDRAECNNLSPRLQQLGSYLDQYLRFEHLDAMSNAKIWREVLDTTLPEQGSGLEQVMEILGRIIIPNGSPIPNPASTAFITTGATNAGVLTQLSALVAAPQRIGLHAFNFLEEKSLEWLQQMFKLPAHMKGVYSSGGSTANIVALGAARQWTFEQLGVDPARDGIDRPCRIIATKASHHTIHRAAAVLGLGRNAVVTVDSDVMGRMRTDSLEQVLSAHKDKQIPIMAIVANAGTTSTGAIDPLHDIGDLAKKHGIWFHVDGAYGLPGILDKRISHLYAGIELADSVIVDPHKWLGAPVGIGATFVRDRNILHRAFTQGASDYLEGACATTDAVHSMDQLGIPYHDFGVELSAPSRGVVVWALIQEIGKTGLAERICRHNDMARQLATLVSASSELEVVQEPTLSICCFRYTGGQATRQDLNELNTRIHRQLVHNNRHIPSTVMINGKLSIRPCFVGARANEAQIPDLVNEVTRIGRDFTDNHKVSYY